MSFRSNKSSSGVHTSDTRPAQRSTYCHGSHCIHTVTSHRSLQSCKITAGRRRSRGLQLGLAAAPEFSHPMQLCTGGCSAQAQVLDPWMVQARGADRCLKSANHYSKMSTLRNCGDLYCRHDGQRVTLVLVCVESTALCMIV